MVKTTYRSWMEDEGIPVVGGYGVTDVRLVNRRPWPRSGGLGAFIDLVGMEGFTGMFVGEIPPRASLRPQKHLYQELICVLDGRGAAEVWLPGDDERRVTFEWGEGSLFAVPLNCWYRLHNGGSVPVIYLGVNDAPMMMDLIADQDFIFGNDWRFTGRFSPRSDYFAAGGHDEVGRVWDTNFIPDVSRAFVDLRERKGSGVRLTNFDMAGSTLNGHLAEWPVGRYHKAHHHQGGAILLITGSVGYSLMWPLEAGVRPYAGGEGDRVIRVDWGPGAVFSPPSKWLHQHFNTGDVPARQLAFRFQSMRRPTGFRRAAAGFVDGVTGVMVSHREGGTMIEYEDEDPRVRRDYEDELARVAVPFDMPPVAYR